MKRVGCLFSRVLTFENLLLAARRAQRSKRYRPDVLAFNWRLEDNLLRLARWLRVGAWQPSPHRHFRILDPKARWISAAPYSDRIVHHALCNIIEPVMDRRFIHDCWANRRGKGTHRAVLRYQRFAGRYRYALKADIRKYFPSIDHAILKEQFRRVFKDRRLLDVMDAIVDRGVVPEPHHSWYPGDDLFTPLERAKGLPIGNLTSQLWANLYLNGFDHWIEEDLRAPAYLRFVDDFVLLHHSKSTLAEWRQAVAERLADLRLSLHTRKCVIRRTGDGLPFLGYVVWPTRIRVRGETVRRFRKRARDRRRSAHESAAELHARSRDAWLGHAALAGGWRRTSIGSSTFN